MKKSIPLFLITALLLVAVPLGMISSSAFTTVKGDADGNGIVTNHDAMMLDRFVANWEGYSQRISDMSAVDLNNDNEVSNHDAMILDRCVANWDGYERFLNGTTILEFTVETTEPVNENPTEEPHSVFPEYDNPYIPKILSAEIVEIFDTNSLKNVYYIQITWEKLDEAYSKYGYCLYYKNDSNEWECIESASKKRAKASIRIEKAGEYQLAVVTSAPHNTTYVAPEDAKFTIIVKYVVDEEAHSYDEPNTEIVCHAACNKCGKLVDGCVKDHPDKIDEWYENYVNYTNDAIETMNNNPQLYGYVNGMKYGDWYRENLFLTKEEFGEQWSTVKYHCLLENCSSAYHSEYIAEIVGYETIEVPETGHFEIG